MQGYKYFLLIVFNAKLIWKGMMKSDIVDIPITTRNLKKRGQHGSP
jgi:hypothetical protein